jgi:hypothetical protein
VRQQTDVAAALAYIAAESVRTGKWLMQNAPRGSPNYGSMVSRQGYRGQYALALSDAPYRPPAIFRRCFQE